MLKKTIYNFSPIFLKNIMASLHGYYLLQRRFGGEYNYFLNELKNRESFSKKEWRYFQEKAYFNTIINAYKNTHYYKSKWDSLGLNINEISKLKNISMLPFLEKKEVKNKKDKILTNIIPKKKLISDYTSGTTGTPLEIWMDNKTLQNWTAMIESRVRNWANIHWGERWAMIGGQLVIPVKRKVPPFWVWNSAFKQLYMSSYHLSENNLFYYLEEIKKKKIVYLYGYATSLFLLAKAAEKFNFEISLKAVFSNAEPLYDSYRSYIQKIFQCPVKNTYSGSEIVCLASECIQGELHISPDSGYVEIVDINNKVCEQGEVGEIVATGLINNVMPLIRYKTGDYGAIIEKKCKCGSNTKILTKLEGRQDDLLYSIDGTPVSRIDPVFKNNFPIKLAQIEQLDYNLIILNIVPEDSFNSSYEGLIKKEIRARLGDVRITINLKKNIALSKNGKFRAVINKMM